MRLRFPLSRLLVMATVLFSMAVPVRATALDDPFESFNRRMFAFNAWLVREVLDPTADHLDAWVPAPVKGVGSTMYANLIEPEFIVTNLMKGNHREAGVSTLRFLVNSTLGLAGAFDPARDLFGLHRHEVEFAEALCATGAPIGPYVVVPLAGPTTMTSLALITGAFAAEWGAASLYSIWLAWANLAQDVVISAASLRNIGELPEDAAHDPYVEQRAGYRTYIAHGCDAGR